MGTGQYSQILGSIVIGGYFCCSDTQYNTNQTAVGTVHMPVNDCLVPLLACNLTDAIVFLDTMLMICCCSLNTITVIIIRVLGFFVVIAMLYTSIGIGYCYLFVFCRGVLCYTADKLLNQECNFLVVQVFHLFTACRVVMK